MIDNILLWFAISLTFSSQAQNSYRSLNYKCLSGSSTNSDETLPACRTYCNLDSTCSGFGYGVDSGDAGTYSNGYCEMYSNTDNTCDLTTYAKNALALEDHSCPRCECASVKTCLDQGLTCQNNGEIPTIVDCSSRTVRCFVNQNEWSQRDDYKCKCPEGWQGSECQLVTPPGDNCTANGLKFDGATYTSDSSVPKRVECVVKYDDAMAQILPLSNHRINISVINKTISFDVKGRITYAPWIDGQNGASDPKKCTAVTNLLSCSVTGCQWYKNKEGDTVYYCRVPKCIACPQGFCDAIRDQLGRLTGPILVTFTNEDSIQGTSMATIALNAGGYSFDLPLSCTTGTCVNTIVDAATQISGVEETPTIAVFSGLSLALGGFFICFFGCVVIARRGVGNAKPIETKELVRKLTSHASSKYKVVDLESSQRNLMRGNERRKSSIPNSEYGLIWENIIFTIPLKNKKKRQVLKNISGMVKSGEMVAILGPSGAGKSSLLDILADRRKGSIQGVVDVTGHVGGGKLQRRDVICYVTQYDDLLDTQTVRETLMFSAMLRSFRNQTIASLYQKVTDVMKQLYIDHIADSIIGNPDIGGISGGERKRLAIGVELVTEPGILLLDEPTSGLDSHSVEVLINVLHGVCKTGCPCIFTIHQVTANHFKSFHKIILLTRVGSLAFHGPPKDSLEFLKEMGKECPLGINPANYLLQVAQDKREEYLLKLSHSFSESKYGVDLHIKLKSSPSQEKKTTS